MLVERLQGDHVTITLPSTVDQFGLQRLIDYAKYLEATAATRAKQADVDKLADDVNANWWALNRNRFVK